MKNFDELLESIGRNQKRRRIAVAAANDVTLLEAARDCLDKGIADFDLVGPRDQIEQLAASNHIDLSGFELHSQPDDLKSAAKAVQLVREGKSDLLMKGYIHTDDFLRAVLNKEFGLRRSGVIMSHCFLIEDPTRGKFLTVTDAAMNISPDLEKKALIVLNAVHMNLALGVARPKVACLTAVELINPTMPATVEAGALSKMADRGQFGVGCDVDGPFALDNAVSELAAKHKKLKGPVAGQADILLVPDIASGNMLAKACVFLCGWRMCGVVLGAACPIVLTSRADPPENKFLSIATAVYLADVERHARLKIGKVHY
ncbi:MAG: Phosphate acetyltransferase [Phycisphaerae bacterium]|nr:Phosphate acetyltransferase [Phycisphaerae bacterium]